MKNKWREVPTFKTYFFFLFPFFSFQFSWCTFCPASLPTILVESPQLSILYLNLAFYFRCAPSFIIQNQNRRVQMMQLWLDQTVVMKSRLQERGNSLIGTLGDHQERGKRGILGRGRGGWHPWTTHFYVCIYLFVLSLHVSAQHTIKRAVSFFSLITYIYSFYTDNTRIQGSTLERGQGDDGWDTDNDEEIDHHAQRAHRKAVALRQWDGTRACHRDRNL